MPEGTEALWKLKDLEGIEGRKLNPERIRVLESLLTASYGPEISLILLQRLRSKKNIVLHLILEQGTEKVDMIAKLFIENSFEVEKEVLSLGAKESLPVPSLWAAQDDVILMEFLNGSPLVDAINETFDSKLIEQLADWYHTFHHKTRHIKGDPQLRNFILTKGEIYGFDFEEYRRGHWMEDIGGISASLLDTRPVFDERKVKLAWLLLEEYLTLSGRERTKAMDVRFTQVIANTLEQTAKWRGDDEILAHSRRVRQYGLPIG